MICYLVKLRILRNNHFLGKKELYRMRTRLSVRSTLSMLSLFSAMPLNFEYVWICELDTVLRITENVLLSLLDFNPLRLALQLLAKLPITFKYLLSSWRFGSTKSKKGRRIQRPLKIFWTVRIRTTREIETIRRMSKRCWTLIRYLFLCL